MSLMSSRNIGGLRLELMGWNHIDISYIYTGIYCSMGDPLPGNSLETPIIIDHFPPSAPLLSSLLQGHF